jgi:hypothetical protein
MLLVPDEKPQPGDIALILLTLGVLQAYVTMVTAIMLWLHRKSRSPEDQPSLLIVGAVFWTGPLIATMEMTAQRPALGFAMALGVAIVALGEMHAAARYFRWRLAPTTQAVAVASILLIVAAQPLLKVENAAAGTNETLLYGLWWLAALILLSAAPGLRRAHDLRVETAVIAAACGAALLHLVAMNHAFYGHAKTFYAAPALAAVSALGFLIPRRDDPSRPAWMLVISFWLPVLAIFFSFDRFDHTVPRAALPMLARDPLFISLTLAAAAWWCGYLRHHWEPLLHTAVLASMYAVQRLLYSGMLTGEMNIAPPSFDTLTAEQRGVALITTAWYLGLVAWRNRSRALLAAGLIMHQLGLASLLPDAWPATDFILTMTWAWTAVLVIHAAAQRPPWILRLIPLLFLVISSWAYTQDPNVAFYAKAHSALIIVALAAAGWAMPWTRYRTCAAVLLVLNTSPFAIHWTNSRPYGPAVAVISAGFALLLLGSVISWYKQTLMARLTLRHKPPDLAAEVQSPEIGV